MEQTRAALTARVRVAGIEATRPRAVGEAAPEVTAEDDAAVRLLVMSADDEQALTALARYHWARHLHGPPTSRLSDLRLAVRLVLAMTVPAEPLPELLTMIAAAARELAVDADTRPISDVLAVVAHADDGTPVLWPEAAALVMPVEAAAHEGISWHARRQLCEYFLTNHAEAVFDGFEKGASTLQEVIAADREVVTARRRQYTSDAHGWRSAFALSLHTLSLSLAASGLVEQAQEYADECARLYARLDAATRQAELDAAIPLLIYRIVGLAGRPGTVTSPASAFEVWWPFSRDGGEALERVVDELLVWADFSNSTGDHDQALAAAREAVAAARTAGHGWLLVRALDILAMEEAEAGDLAAAVDTSSEAVRVADALHPVVAGADFAMILTRSANHLAETGAAAAALDRSRRAVAHASDADPETLAWVLNNLGNHLSDAGYRAEGVTATAEAARVYAEVVILEPTSLTYFAAVLNNLSNRYKENSGWGHAEKLMADVVDIRRKLVADTPSRQTTADLAGSYNNWSLCLTLLDQLTKAVSTARESVRLYRSLATSFPALHRHDLAMALSTLAVALSESGEHGPAIRAGEEATTIYRELVDLSPNTHRAKLDVAVVEWGDVLLRADQPREAATRYREARSSPAATPVVRLAAAQGLGRAYAALGDAATAFRWFEDACTELAHVTPMTMDRRDRELELIKVSGLSSAAAAAALAAGRPKRALELLEQARGVLTKAPIDRHPDWERLVQADRDVASKLSSLHQRLIATEPSTSVPRRRDTPGSAEAEPVAQPPPPAELDERILARIAALRTGKSATDPSWADLRAQTRRFAR